MKKQKKTIKEEFREFIKKELLAITPYDEKKILDFIKQVFQRFIKETDKELREELAELEHKQWENWTKYITEHLFDVYEQGKENRNDEIAQMKGLAWLIDKELVPMIRKWQKNWKPYSELTEEEKNKDRIWADKVLEKLHQKQQQWLKENL